MDGAGVSRGRLPGATTLGCPGSSHPCEPRGETTQPTPGMTGESTPGIARRRGEGVALRVDDRDIGRVERAPGPHRDRPGDAVAAVGDRSQRVRIAGRRQVGPGAVLPDQRAPRLGVLLRQEPVGGHFHVRAGRRSTPRGRRRRASSPRSGCAAPGACCGRGRASRSSRSGSASAAAPAPGTRSRTPRPRIRRTTVLSAGAISTEKSARSSAVSRPPSRAWYSAMRFAMSPL